MSDSGKPRTPGGGSEGATAWLSRGFEDLAAQRDAEPAPDHVDFDVVIVGSGYGGAVAAARLAGTTDATGRKINVCVLERGREYLPGMFPPRLSDLAGHVRFSTGGASCARGEREGLFDMRIGADVSALVANGLGGGSLINAGVMAAPAEDVFARRDWPEAIRNESPEDRKERFAHLKERLGAAVRADRIPGFDLVRAQKRELVDNTVELERSSIPAKFVMLRRMATPLGGKAEHFDAASITVALTKGRVSSAGVTLNECLRCGDCATGCNHGAKDSLDVNLLRTAGFAGAHIYTGATVLKLEGHYVEVDEGADGSDAGFDDDAGITGNNAWILDVVHTDADLRSRQGGPFRLVARKVILAAGTFGSTEILLRSRSDELVFSARLGQNFSTNGDMIAVAYDQKVGGRYEGVNAVADERVPPGSRHVGPTITGIVDLRGEKEQVVIEEMAVPGPLRRAFEEIVTTGNVLRGLSRADRDPHTSDGPRQDPCAVDADAIRNSSMFAIMGDDGARGALELVGGTGDADESERDGDGAIRVRWPEARDHPIFQKGLDALRDLGKASGVHGDVQPNPAWQILPDEMQFLMEDKRGPLMTVHPLGGCPMGDAGGPVPDPADKGSEQPRLLTQGVVNDRGQVFDCRQSPGSRAVFRTLVVLDGSIVPTALGINPSLTIASLAWRAIELLRKEWGISDPSLADPTPGERPVFRKPPDPKPPVPTLAQVIERMSGEALLPAKNGGSVLARIELTMQFEPFELASLMLPSPEGGPVKMRREMVADPKKSRVRVFVASEWNEWHRNAGREEELDGKARFIAPLSGKVAFMHREETKYRDRRCAAFVAWVMNRGLRDTWQSAAGKVKALLNGTQTLFKWDGSEHKKVGFLQGLKKRFDSLLALASHSGEVRLFEYDLKIGEPPKKREEGAFDFSETTVKHAIRGKKRITYARRSNPWRQMSRLSLDEFPGLVPGDEAPVLEIDVSYLTEQRVPLLRVLRQEDEVATIADLGSLAGYFLRLLLSIHVWSFRKPDPADPGEPQRLPGIVKGLPNPEITEFDVAYLPDGRPVRARLTRYPRPSSTLPPLLMIPGYSASGTTYAHPALDPHAAGYFWDRGRDIWILDMRTSAGMPTARLPWKFEDAALADIPKAIDFIWNATERQRRVAKAADSAHKDVRIDVLAHCMGSVMFSMAMLAPPAPGDPYFREREALPGRIGRIVLSQIGPVVNFTPDNVLRAYVMSYIRAFLPLEGYEFRIGPSPSLANQLIDRALATMPYPDSEFDIENPRWPCKRTPWVGSRHRMDALYGRDFNVENMSPRALDAIDDLFGPLSTDTVAQAIHFARLGVITNHAGRSVFATRRNLIERWKKAGPTMSIHGVQNGLYDVSTLARMTKLFEKDLGLPFVTRAFDGMGHQDCLIGKRSREVFDCVEQFLGGNLR